MTIKKKRFNLSPELSRGFSETINIVENDKGTFRNATIPFSRIELDPNNPRNLHLNIDDIKNGIDQNDVYRKDKLKELERIQELSNTISTAGLINPIVVYQRGDLYRVVAGERRCLASILLGKTEIEAKIYNELPSSLDLKIIQWIENNAREDLSLSERIENLKEIQTAYQVTHNKDISATELSKIAGISHSQSACYLSVIRGPQDVLDLIKKNQLSSLDKASIIANASSEGIRKKLIAEVLQGVSVKKLRSQVKEKNKQNLPKKIRLSIGPVNPNVIKIIIKALGKSPSLKSIIPDSSQVNFDKVSSLKSYFEKLINSLEQVKEIE